MQSDSQSRELEIGAPGHRPVWNSAGNGHTEPLESWLQCSCGILIWSWQQFYEESEDDSADRWDAHMDSVAPEIARIRKVAEALEEWERHAPWTDNWRDAYVALRAAVREWRGRAERAERWTVVLARRVSLGGDGPARAARAVRPLFSATVRPVLPLMNAPFAAAPFVGGTQ